MSIISQVFSIRYSPSHKFCPFGVLTNIELRKVTELIRAVNYFLGKSHTKQQPIRLVNEKGHHVSLYM